VLAHAPDGVLVSNGPGDPATATETIATVRALIGAQGAHVRHLPGAADHRPGRGARTYKLPFGHHGGNHPVQDLATGIIEITAQNHNYAVEPSSLEGLPLPRDARQPV
jgi:carbamoyl-phosphate synthase small subunit